MLQWLYTYVVSVCSKCFNVSDVFYSKCFMLQVFHEQAQAEAIPASAGGPHVRAGAKRARVVPQLHADGKWNGAGERSSKRSRRGQAQQARRRLQQHAYTQHCSRRGHPSGHLDTTHTVIARVR
jgi:hypothetical protein